MFDFVFLLASFFLSGLKETLRFFLFSLLFQMERKKKIAICIFEEMKWVENLLKDSD